MSKKLDDKEIIIIGGGPGGYKAALEIRKQFSEQKIILIEKYKLGGTCLHVGCIPSKQLHSIDDINNFPKLIKKNRTILERAIASELKAADVEVITAEAKVNLEKETVGFEDQELGYSHLVIATGSKPRQLEQFSGSVTSDSFFKEGQEFADKYCFIGGGYIGIELASMLAQHGKEVRIYEMLDTILGFLDYSIHEKLIQELIKQKISINTGFKDLSQIELEEGEQVFVSIGREAVFPKGVNADSKANNLHIIGDASQEIALAHYAYAQAKALASKLAGEEKTIELDKVPLVIFTHPEVAGIGLNTHQAKEKYGDDAIEERIINWASNGKAKVTSNDRGLTKWIIKKDDGKILGCHLIGKGATDLISIAIPIINQRLTIQDTQDWIYPHPTLGELFEL